MNCGWEPGGEPHDGAACEYEPDLPAERTGEFAILDWPYYQWSHECRFSAGGDDPDDRQWVLAEIMIKPGAEEGFYEPVDDLGDDKMLTACECRKLTEQMGCGVLIGD